MPQRPILQEHATAAAQVRAFRAETSFERVDTREFEHALGANALPGFNAAGPTPEQGMALWRPERAPLAIVRRATHGELPEQMLPLILKLPACYSNGSYAGAYGANLGTVKSVAAR
jgi:hypothetical protein